MPIFENKFYPNAKYNYLGGDQKRIAKGANEYLQWIKEHPPRLLGWLLGGVDKERMIKIKEEIERRINSPEIL